MKINETTTARDTMDAASPESRHVRLAPPPGPTPWKPGSPHKGAALTASPTNAEATMTIETHIPAHVRHQVQCEGSCQWRRVVEGGVLLLETRRTGTRLVTILVGVETGIRELAAFP